MWCGCKLGFSVPGCPDTRRQGYFPVRGAQMGLGYSPVHGCSPALASAAQVSSPRALAFTNERFRKHSNIVRGPFGHPHGRQMSPSRRARTCKRSMKRTTSRRAWFAIARSAHHTRGTTQDAIPDYPDTAAGGRSVEEI